MSSQTYTVYLCVAAPYSSIFIGFFCLSTSRHFTSQTSYFYNRSDQTRLSSQCYVACCEVWTTTTGILSLLCTCPVLKNYTFNNLRYSKKGMWANVRFYNSCVFGFACLLVVSGCFLHREEEQLLRNLGFLLIFIGGHSIRLKWMGKCTFFLFFGIVMVQNIQRVMP